MNKGGRPTKYKPEMCQQAIALMSEGISITGVAAELGICKDTIHAWKKQHPEFGDALKRGSELSQAWWEKVGINGTLGKIKGFQPSTWSFNMRNRFSGDWVERTEHKIEGHTNLVDRLTAGRKRVEEGAERFSDPDTGVGENDPQK